MCCKLPRSRILIMLGHDFLLNGQRYYLEKSLLLTHTPFPLFFPSAYFCKYKEQQPSDFLLEVCQCITQWFYLLGGRHVALPN